MLKFAKILFVTGLLFSSIYCYTGEVVKEIGIQVNFPTGLTYDGKNFWIADRETDRIYCLEAVSGKVLRSISSPAYWPTGLAWDGKNLWNADAKTQKIYCLNPETGNIIKTLDYPEKVPEGLTFDGKYLWACDNSADIIVQISTVDGTTIRTFPSPSTDPRGICYDGDYFWISDRMEDKIYMVDDETGDVIFATDSPSQFPRGMTWDKKNVWVVDYHTDKLYQLKVRDGEKFRRFNKRTARTILTNRIQNFGTGDILTLDLHFALPVNRDNQTIAGNFEYSEKPGDYITDQWDQETAVFHYENIEAGTTISPVMKVNSEIYEIQYFVYPDEIGTLADIPKKIKDKYLVNDEKYQLQHSVIQKAVQDAIGTEKNPYRMARNLYNYLLTKMYYEMVGGWNTAPTVLARGNGSCSEYAFVYIALCRAAGIPARYVGSVVVRGDDTSYDNVFHRWCEIYLPNFGWIPVDPSGGDQETPALQAKYFGHLDNRFLITTQSGGGSKTMGWTYNFNQFWTTEPQTKVEAEHFADWERVK